MVFAWANDLLAPYEPWQIAVGSAIIATAVSWIVRYVTGN